MSPLRRKLVRDLGQLKGQVLTIALVVACGIASYVTIQGTYRSTLLARSTYYERHHFPDAFVPVERAPLSLAARALALPGVALVHPRVVKQVSLPVAGMAEPATGQVIGLPAHGEPPLGGVMLREGRMPLPGRGDEVVLLEAFAKAHGLRAGSRLTAVLGGIRHELRVVGVALAPEFVFAIAPGELIPDPRRFGVLWMDSDVVAAAFRMQGAFNELLVRLQPGASGTKAIAALDRLFEPYGCFGAYERSRQLSNQVLQSDLDQLKTMTTITPTIFLGVAAFLINVVLSRLVQLQRIQIATLKAVGYSRRAIGLHYFELALVVVVFGSLLGVGLGVWLGQLMTESYTTFFHFPDLRYVAEWRVLVMGMLISLFAALAGALGSVRAVMQLPPAEAMRPEAPASYRRAISERLKLTWLFGQSARMVLRELERRPVRALLSMLGVALSVALLVSGRFGYDSVDWYMRVQFELAEREDLSVSFRRSVGADAVGEIADLPRVLRAEGARIISVRFRSGHRSRQCALFGYENDAELRRVLDVQGEPFPLPKDGLVLNLTLANILDLSVGDQVTVEVLDGTRGEYRVPVVGVVDEVTGLYGHMLASEMARMLGDEGQINIALLRVDPHERHALQRALRARPDVLGVNRHDAAIEMFEKHTAGQMRYTTLILTLFASMIACGVIYNNARIALSTRSRDLASLRVLGFRRSEISAILLGELALQVVLALGPGMLLGYGMASFTMAQNDPELYRFPVVVSARTYAFAVLVTLGAALVSALLVRRSLDHLDLIGVLKSRE
jgi:putative ABC transport system permease protein